MNLSSFSLRARATSRNTALANRKNFLRLKDTRRKQLRIEALETRAVFNVDPMSGALAGNCGAPATDNTDEVHVVFAPDTPLATVLSYEDLAHQDGTAAFTFGDTDRWNRTTSSGTNLQQGDSTIIRWSVVPDGTAISGYNGEPAAPSNLRSWLAGIYGSNASSTRAQDQPWFDEIQSVFDRWSAVSGVIYVYEAADDGAALGSQASGVLNVRGDVRISGHYIDGPSNILAYNFFPTVGDMVLDTADTFFNNTGSNSIRLRNTMAHEAGHGLGLGHVTPVNGTKLMEPSISLAYDGPQADDILAVNRGYGDRLEKSGGNNTAATATSLGTTGTFSFDTISIDDDSDVDWFQVTVGAGSSLSVTVTPTGSTYTSGSTTFDSLSQSNLAFSIYSGNGTTVLTTVNATAAGLAESLSNYSLPGAGTYYVRISGSANAAQMYRLAGSVSNVTATAPEIAVLDGQTNVVDNSGSVSFGSVQSGGSLAKTFTIQNLGNANLTLGSTVTLPTGFILTQAPLATTIAPGGSTTFTVSLDTAVAGTFSGALSFTNNDADENPFNFALSGTVTTSTPVTAPEISILDGTTELIDGSSTLDFGSVGIGGTATKTLTIRNTGTGNLTLSQLVLPTSYSIVAGPGATIIAPGGSTTLTLGLNTSTAGTFTGGISLANNDADEGPFNFNVTGTVNVTTPTTAPEISVLDGATDLVDGQSSVNFGSTTVGGVLSKTFTIRNTGTANLTLSSILLPTAYSILAGPGLTTIAPGVSTTITISLNTSTAGTFSGQMSLGNNDANEGPFDLTLSGTVTGTTQNPTALFNDNFNRANNSLLGSNWTERTGNYSIVNQGLQSTSTGTSLATLDNVTSPDVILTADINLGFGTAARDTGLFARHSGNGIGSQYWGGIAYTGGRYYAQIWEANNGSWTRLSQAQVSSGVAALKFEVIGTSLKLYVNNALVTSASDNTLTSGRVGVSSEGAGMRLDNFAAYRPASALTAAAAMPKVTAVAPVTNTNTNAVAATAAASAAAQQLAALDQLLALWGLQNVRR